MYYYFVNIIILDPYEYGTVKLCNFVMIIAKVYKNKWLKFPPKSRLGFSIIIVT